MIDDSSPDPVIRPRDLGHRTLNRLQGQWQGWRHLTVPEDQARLNYLDELELIVDAIHYAQELMEHTRVRQGKVQDQLTSVQSDAALATVREELEALAEQRTRALERIRDRMQRAEIGAQGFRQQMTPFAGYNLTSRYDGSYAGTYPLPDISGLGSIYWEIDRAAKDFEAEESNEQRYAELLALGKRRAAFLASSLTVSLRVIDAFHWRRFEAFISTLLEDDGFVMERRSGGPGDRGIDVIGVSLDSRRLVAQCKHSPDSDSKVGTPELQKLNGNAKLVHKGDIGVMVTNQGFTKDAVEFAADQELHLVDRDALRRWATWGDPLMQILGLPALPERPPSVRAA